MDTDNGRLAFNIVLYQPEIPSNTGNIGRICVGCYAKLHIVKPMRFLLTDKLLTRAGLDYWDKLNLTTHDNLDCFYSAYHGEKVYLCSTKGKKCYTDIEYKPGDAFMFGPETKGLPDSLLEQYSNQVIKIPMSQDIRSINLANSVAIILYEALRQNRFNALI